jgi:origin recognition complex subunit 4
LPLPVATPKKKKGKLTSSHSSGNAITSHDHDTEMVELSPRKPKAYHKSLLHSPSPSPTAFSHNYTPADHNLNLQKAALLKSIYSPPTLKEQDDENSQTKKGLDDLLRGTLERGEGNSCFVVGPKGSGKTKVCPQLI